MNDAERQLIANAQAGSAAAFASLVDLHQRSLRMFLQRMCGSRDDADDLAQESFLAAWTEMRRFRPEGSFRAWLFGIAYRKFLSERRSLSRRLRREAIAAPEEGIDPAEAHDAARDLKRAMLALPPDKRAVVALCFVAEMSHKEASEALGIPLGTVKSHAQRGRAQLILELRRCDG